MKKIIVGLQLQVLLIMLFFIFYFPVILLTTDWGGGGGGVEATHTKMPSVGRSVLSKQIFIKEIHSPFFQFKFFLPVAIALPFTSSVEINIIVNDVVYLVLFKKN